MVILHFQPLERFPPVMNLLDFLSAKNDKNIVVITTANRKESLLEAYANTSITIVRTPAIVPKTFLRLFNYIRFYGYSLWLLLRIKPRVVLYYETLSSWPALIYKKLNRNSVNLLLHCHEYTSPENYNDMWLVRKMHRMETKMYPTSYVWISHTNPVRMEQFKRDHDLQNANPDIFHVMPNYPPKLWSDYQNNFGSADKIRLVFVGSLGFDNMYLEEIVNWVTLNKDFLSLDIYAYNIDKKAKDLLQNKDNDCIEYFGGVSYEILPQTLKNYDVGLVMYKPFSYNTVIAVSNKVFEYLACGLDVWFSEDMTYTLSYSRLDSYPKIIPLNFKRLDEFDYMNALKREDLNQADDNYFYENIYEAIYESMSNFS